MPGQVRVADPVAAVSASAGSADGSSGDPRTPDKLMDGVYHTTDDLHSWLAPLEPGDGAVTVTVALDAPVTLGLLRVRPSQATKKVIPS